MNNNSIQEKPFEYNKHNDSNNLEKSNKTNCTCRFINKATRLNYLSIKLNDPMKKNYTKISNDSLFQQPYLFDSPNTTLAIKGKVCSNHDIKIIAKNLIVKGELKTSKELTIQLQGMLVIEGAGIIEGKEGENITCDEKVTHDSVQYFK